MTIDWLHFTPGASFAGGLLIGLAVSLLLLINGRIAGISGILGDIVRHAGRSAGWQWAFIAGLIISPFAFSLIAPIHPPSHIAAWPWLIGAGLLVGLGTRLANGCTSGHGICGIARLSRRSIVATLTFMLAGIVTVYVTRHVLRLL